MRCEFSPGVRSFTSGIPTARISQAAPILAELERQIFFQVRDDLHALHALRTAIENEAQALAAGTRRRWPDESALCDSALAFVRREMARADAAYLLIGLAAPQVRARFALRPAQRGAMVEDAVTRGFVSNVRGYRFEVLS
jgi:hypothetical protein